MSFPQFRSGEGGGIGPGDLFVSPLSPIFETIRAFTGPIEIEPHPRELEVAAQCAQVQAERRAGNPFVRGGSRDRVPPQVRSCSGEYLALVRSGLIARVGQPPLGQRAATRRDFVAPPPPPTELVGREIALDRSQLGTGGGSIPQGSPDFRIDSLGRVVFDLAELLASEFGQQLLRDGRIPSQPTEGTVATASTSGSTSAPTIPTLQEPVPVDQCARGGPLDSACDLWAAGTPLQGTPEEAACCQFNLTGVPPGSFEILADPLRRRADPNVNDPVLRGSRDDPHRIAANQPTGETFCDAFPEQCPTEPVTGTQAAIQVARMVAELLLRRLQRREAERARDALLDSQQAGRQALIELLLRRQLEGFMPFGQSGFASGGFGGGFSGGGFGDAVVDILGDLGRVAIDRILPGSTPGMPGGFRFDLPSLPTTTGGAVQTLAGCPSFVVPSNASGMRMRHLVEVPGPDGRTHWYRNVGRPLVWSGDLATVKRVKRVRGKLGKR